MEVEGKKVAGMGVRIIAGIIDLIIVFVIIWFTGKVFGTATVTDNEVSVTGFPVILGALLAYSLFALMEFKIHTTPGKMLFGLVALTEAGAPMTLQQSFQRNLMRFVDYFFLIGLIVALSCGEKRQRIGDRIAKTIVFHK